VRPTRRPSSQNAERRRHQRSTRNLVSSIPAARLRANKLLRHHRTRRLLLLKRKNARRDLLPIRTVVKDTAMTGTNSPARKDGATDRVEETDGGTRLDAAGCLVPADATQIRDRRQQKRELQHAVADTRRRLRPGLGRDA